MWANHSHGIIVHFQFFSPKYMEDKWVSVRVVRTGPATWSTCNMHHESWINKLYSLCNFRSHQHLSQFLNTSPGEARGLRPADIVQTKGSEHRLDWPGTKDVKHAWDTPLWMVSMGESMKLSMGKWSVEWWKMCRKLQRERERQTRTHTTDISI